MQEEEQVRGDGEREVEDKEEEVGEEYRRKRRKR